VGGERVTLSEVQVGLVVYTLMAATAEPGAATADLDTGTAELDTGTADLGPRPPLVVGVDEVGRGSAIGPLYVAAVIIRDDVDKTLVRDSKKLSPSRRILADTYIRATAFAYEIEPASMQEIEDLNVTGATIAAWHRCLERLTRRFGRLDKVIVDGTGWKPFADVPAVVEPKADDRYPCVAAASVLAKVARDRYIGELVNEHPELRGYGIERNMGYLSSEHLHALRTHGRTKFHRRGFKIKALNE
jgi:ribonuclease HII